MSVLCYVILYYSLALFYFVAFFIPEQITPAPIRESDRQRKLNCKNSWHMVLIMVLHGILYCIPCILLDSTNCLLSIFIWPSCSLPAQPELKPPNPATQKI